MRYAVIPVLDRLLILAIGVAQFLIGHGRIWAKPFDWDRSILLSYVTIAVLVFADLAIRRRLQWVSWFLHTLELAGVKFGLTAGFLLVLLITHQFSPKPIDFAGRPLTAEGAAAQPVPELKEPSIIPEEQRGEIKGRVLGRDGRPVSRALVFISAGLQKLVFPAPQETVVLENDGRQFLPAVGVVQVGQPLVVRSINRELHTLLMMKRDRSWVFNIPMLASGEPRSLSLHDAKGLVRVQCTVHGKREGNAHLVVLGHPFYAFTGPEGRFELRRVPAGSLSTFAFHAVEGEASATFTLTGGGQAEANLLLSPTNY